MRLRLALGFFRSGPESSESGMAYSISAITSSTASSSSLSCSASAFTPQSSGLLVKISASSSSVPNVWAVLVISASYSLSSFLSPSSNSSLKVSWFLTSILSYRSCSSFLSIDSRFFRLMKVEDSSMISTSLFMRMSVSRGDYSQKSLMLRARSMQQCSYQWWKRKRRKSYCGPSYAPESWYFQMTCLDSLWYLSTVMAMTTALRTNYSTLRLQVILLLLMLFLSPCLSSSTLKKTHSDQDSFLTSACPRSMYCLTKSEMVCTAFALISSLLVYHQSSSSRMKQLPRSSSLTLLWQIILQSPSIARMRMSPSESSTRSCSFLRYFSQVKPSYSYEREERSNLTMKSVVTFRVTITCSLIRYEERWIQQRGRKVSTLFSSSRQQRPSRMSPWDWSTLARSSLMTGMKSSMLREGLSLLRMRMIDLVFTPSIYNCSSIPTSLIFSESSSRLSPCAYSLAMLARASSLSLRRLFSSGLFHSAMICFISISQWSGQSARMAVPISKRRSQEQLIRGRSQQLSIILRWCSCWGVRGGQRSSPSMPASPTQKYYSSATVRFKESNILLRPSSSADRCSSITCRHSLIVKRSRPRTNSVSTFDNSIPEGTHSSKMAFSSELSDLPMFLSHMSSLITFLPVPFLCICLSSVVMALVKLQSCSRGSSSTMSETRLSKRAQRWGWMSRVLGAKCSTNSGKASLLGRKREKQRRVYCWIDVSLLPYPSYNRWMR